MDYGVAQNFDVLGQPFLCDYRFGQHVAGSGGQGQSKERDENIGPQT